MEILKIYGYCQVIKFMEKLNDNDIIQGITFNSAVKLLTKANKWPTA